MQKKAASAADNQNMQGMREGVYISFYSKTLAELLPAVPGKTPREKNEVSFSA
ncbi:MAG: hypothetical protein J6D38_06500 [Solobacterium sp.]|nr:hypothetical protein [Solobacterium sp.]